MPLTLSVIIITHNEAGRIEDCLRSVAWADEIIVIDSDSTDDTVMLCKQYTEHIFVMDWPGFGPQKNRALSKATGDWVLSLDADERISNALADEIRALLALEPAYTSYDIRRFSYYLGKMLRYGSCKNDYCLRLFKRTSGAFTNDLVHEKWLAAQGKTGTLKNPMFHYSFTSPEQVLHKMNLYSTISAQTKYKKGQRATLLKAIVHGAWTFFKHYFLKLGVLDGQEGFLLAVSNAEGSYYRYIKMLYIR